SVANMTGRICTPFTTACSLRCTVTQPSKRSAAPDRLSLQAVGIRNIAGT
ncbi:hypothetical protein ADUPG1_006319, partial [Aduncisulcus paluster]